MLVYIALALVIFSLFLLIVYCYQFFRWLSGKPGKQKAKKAVKRPGFGLLFVLLLMLFASMTLFFAGFFMYSFHALTQETRVADILITEVTDNNTFSLRIYFAPDADSKADDEYVLNGDQWMVEADILKWESWLVLAGAETRYRLTRLRGRYRHSSEEMARQATIIALDPRENHVLWRYLYRFGPGLPFVDTVYGNAVYQDARAGQKFSVYISNSGLTVRPFK